MSTRNRNSLLCSKHHPFLLPSWRNLRSYRHHLEEWDPIWGDDWSHSPFIRRSPSWGFQGFSSAVNQMPGSVYSPQDHFIITLIISDRRDWCDTRGKWRDGGEVFFIRNSWWQFHEMGVDYIIIITSIMNKLGNKELINFPQLL